MNTHFDLTEAPKNPQSHPLFLECTLVESKLLALQDVSIDTTALARPGCDDGEQTTSLELLLDGVVDLSGCLDTLSLLLLDALGLLLLLLFLGTGLGGPATAELGAVVGLVPLSEGSGINLDDSGLGEGVGTDELVVGGVVDDTNHTGLLGNAFGAP
jgi:hypothetical protein